MRQGLRNIALSQMELGPDLLCVDLRTLSSPKTDTNVLPCVSDDCSGSSSRMQDVDRCTTGVSR